MDLAQAKIELKKMVPAFAAKVAPIYKLLDWQWEPVQAPSYIPDVAAIEACLNACIDDLDSECVTCGRGGLEAYFEPSENGEPGYYGLHFILQDDEAFD